MKYLNDFSHFINCWNYKEKYIYYTIGTKCAQPIENNKINSKATQYTSTY